MSSKILLFMLIVLAAVTPAYPQTPIRTFEIDLIEEFAIDGGVPNAALLDDADGNPVVVLLYTSQQGLVEAASTDGITFTNIGQPFRELQALLRPQNLLPTDVIVRQTEAGNWRYFIKGLPAPGVEERLIYAAEREPDGSVSLLNDGLPVYEGQEGGGRRVEVIDIIPTLAGDWRMFYVGLNEQPETVHTALSSDEGLTWAYESENTFEDNPIQGSPLAEQINVDPAPFRLNDGTYMAVTMRGAKFYFWNSTDGLAFTPVPDVVLTPQDVSQAVDDEVMGLFDPTLVQMPDNTIYLYFTAGKDTMGYILAAKINIIEQ
jgi:hypothetical protein